MTALNSTKSSRYVQLVLMKIACKSQVLEDTQKHLHYVHI